MIELFLTRVFVTFELEIHVRVSKINAVLGRNNLSFGFPEVICTKNYGVWQVFKD